MGGMAEDQDDREEAANRREVPLGRWRLALKYAYPSLEALGEGTLKASEITATITGPDGAEIDTEAEDVAAYLREEGAQDWAKGVAVLVVRLLGTFRGRDFSKPDVWATAMGPDGLLGKLLHAEADEGQAGGFLGELRSGPCRALILKKVDGGQYFSQCGNAQNGAGCDVGSHWQQHHLLTLVGDMAFGQTPLGQAGMTVAEGCTDAEMNVLLREEAAQLAAGSEVDSGIAHCGGCNSAIPAKCMTAEELQALQGMSNADVTMCYPCFTLLPKFTELMTFMHSCENAGLEESVAVKAYPMPVRLETVKAARRRLVASVLRAKGIPMAQVWAKQAESVEPDARVAPLLRTVRKGRGSPGQQRVVGGHAVQHRQDLRDEMDVGDLATPAVVLDNLYDGEEEASFTPADQQHQRAALQREEAAIAAKTRAAFEAMKTRAEFEALKKEAQESEGPSMEAFRAAFSEQLKGVTAEFMGEFTMGAQKLREQQEKSLMELAQESAAYQAKLEAKMAAGQLRGKAPMHPLVQDETQRQLEWLEERKRGLAAEVSALEAAKAAAARAAMMVGPGALPSLLVSCLADFFAESLCGMRVLRAPVLRFEDFVKGEVKEDADGFKGRDEGREANLSLPNHENYSGQRANGEGGPKDTMGEDRRFKRITKDPRGVADKRAAVYEGDKTKEQVVKLGDAEYAMGARRNPDALVPIDYMQWMKWVQARMRDLESQMLRGDFYFIARLEGLADAEEKELIAAYQRRNMLMLMRYRLVVEIVAVLMAERGARVGVCEGQGRSWFWASRYLNKFLLNVWGASESVFEVDSAFVHMQDYDSELVVMAANCKRVDEYQVVGFGTTAGPMNAVAKRWFREQTGVCITTSGWRTSTSWSCRSSRRRRLRRRRLRRLGALPAVVARRAAKARCRRSVCSARRRCPRSAEGTGLTGTTAPTSSSPRALGARSRT